VGARHIGDRIATPTGSDPIAEKYREAASFAASGFAEAITPPAAPRTRKISLTVIFVTFWLAIDRRV